MQNRDHQMSWGPALTPAVKLLLILNVSVGIALVLLKNLAPSLATWMVDAFALSPLRVVSAGAVWQLLSYGFLHVRLEHLLWNSLALWMFGGEIESLWGRRPFLLFYGLCLMGGGLFVLAKDLLFGGQSWVMGCSAAVLGLVVAYGMLFADRPISLLFPPVTLAAKWLAIAWVALDFLFYLEGGRQIAYAAHLGGMTAAFLYLRLPFRFSAGPRLHVRGIGLLESFHRWFKRRKLRVVRSDDDDISRGPTLH